jgi:hypothetical protein
MAHEKLVRSYTSRPGETAVAQFSADQAGLARDGWVLHSWQSLQIGEPEDGRITIIAVYQDKEGA